MDTGESNELPIDSSRLQKRTDSLKSIFSVWDWLQAQDISCVDESLDADAARLLLLNNAILEEGGQVLAALIVTASDENGLHVLADLANGSEPRLAIMAILNLLYVLKTSKLEHAEFIVSLSPDADPNGASEMTLSQADMPSEALVATKISLVMPEIACVFIQNVVQGDFCCDFLIGLLTLLMDLSQQVGKTTEVAALNEKIPTITFLKCIMRTWKHADLHQHVSETEGHSNMTLGFLVTCYLKSLCLETSPALDTDISDIQPEGDFVGIEALTHMGDWAIRFIAMRMYDHSASNVERSYLAGVLQHCAVRDKLFADSMLRLSILPAISFAMDSLHSPTLQHQADISELSMLDLSQICFSFIPLLVSLVDRLLPIHITPSSGIWLNNKQGVISISLCKALRSAYKCAVQLLVFSSLQESVEGKLRKLKAIYVFSKLAVQIWRCGAAVLFRQYSTRFQKIREAYVGLFKELQLVIEDCCTRKEAVWKHLLSSEEMLPVRVILAACHELAKYESGVKDNFIFEEDGPVCELCLEVPHDKPLRMCARCKKVSYCCNEHQSVHWKMGHKEECMLLRNCFQGSSFTRDENGTIPGLFKETDAVALDLEIPFADLVASQRKELSLLDCQLPGVLVEVDGNCDSPRKVLYQTRSEIIHGVLKEKTYDYSGTMKLSNGVKLGVMKSLIHACDRQCMLYLRKGGTKDRQETHFDVSTNLRLFGLLGYATVKH